MPAISEDYLHNLPPQDRRYDAPVADELVLNVFPNGVKTWVHLYPFEGFTRRRTIGVFPDMSLTEALAGLEQSQQLVRLETQEGRQGDEPPAPAPPLKTRRKAVPIVFATIGAAAIAVMATHWMTGPALDEAAQDALPDATESIASTRQDAATGVIVRPGQSLSGQAAEQTGTAGLADEAPVDEIDIMSPAAVADRDSSQPPDNMVVAPSTPVAESPPDVELSVLTNPQDGDADGAHDGMAAQSAAPYPPRAQTTSDLTTKQPPGAIGVPASPPDDWQSVTHLDQIGTPILVQRVNERRFDQRHRGSFDHAPVTMVTGDVTAVTALTTPQGIPAPNAAIGDSLPAMLLLDGAGQPLAGAGPETSTRTAVAETIGATASEPGPDRDGQIIAAVDRAGLPDAAANSASSNPRWSVTLSRLADAVEGDEPIGDIGPALTVQPEQTSAVYYLTELKNMAGETVTHRWEHDGQVVAEHEFQLRGNRWRVYSGVNVLFEQTGDWRVSVTAADNTVLEDRRFSVRIDRSALASEPVQRVAQSAAGEANTRSTTAQSMAPEVDDRAKTDVAPQTLQASATDRPGTSGSASETGETLATVTTGDGNVLPVVVLTDPDTPDRQTKTAAQADGADTDRASEAITAATTPEVPAPPSDAASDAFLAAVSEPPVDTDATLDAVPGELVEQPAATSLAAATAVPAGSSEIASPEPQEEIVEPVRRPPARVTDEHILVGQVVKIRGTLLTLRALDGSGRSAYRVPRGATVLLDGVETRLQDLLPGQVINIKTSTEVRAVGR